MKAIKAREIYTPLERIQDGVVLVSKGKVQAITSRIPEGAEVRDFPRARLVPGFLNWHVHGAGGHDCMEGTREALEAISRLLAQHGTTGFLFTTLTAPAEELTRVCRSIHRESRKPLAGAQALGIHMEGPFLSVQKRGCHPAEHVVVPSEKMLQEWSDASEGFVKLMTFAPEIPGAMDLMRAMQRRGISPALGHSMATYEEARVAIHEGARYAVHAFNAMRPFDHREPGIPGAVLIDDRVVAEIIVDGVHIHPAAIRIFARCKGAAGVHLATDGLSPTGMAEGQYYVGKKKISVTGGVCRDEEGVLAGSILTQERALRNFLQWTGSSMEEALRGLTLNPARALGLDPHKGRIAPGSDADLVALDDDFRVLATWVAGDLVYESC